LEAKTIFSSKKNSRKRVASNTKVNVEWHNLRLAKEAYSLTIN
jgi:hypothetical protein